MESKIPSRRSSEACENGVENAISERERRLVRDVTAIVNELETISQHDEMLSGRMTKQWAEGLCDAVDEFAESDPHAQE